MNALFSSFGLLDWKPWLTAILLPPVPLLGMLVLAWWWQRRRPALSSLLLFSAVLALWFSSCHVTGALLERQLATAPSLSIARLAELRRSINDGHSAVVVLGGGVRALAPEYGEAHLENTSMERLLYGLWLARQLQLPVLYSGGAGWATADGPSEAQVAARISTRDLGRNLRWVETQSRDTRDNAHQSLPMLRRDGITQVLLVTHGWHMQRALRAFEQAAQQQNLALRILPAPMGMVADRNLSTSQRWMPSNEGYVRVRQALREWVGLLVGA